MDTINKNSIRMGIMLKTVLLSTADMKAKSNKTLQAQYVVVALSMAWLAIDKAGCDGRLPSLSNATSVSLGAQYPAFVGVGEGERSRAARFNHLSASANTSFRESPNRFPSIQSVITARLIITSGEVLRSMWWRSDTIQTGGEA